MFALSASPKSTPSARPSSDTTGPEFPSSTISESSTTKAAATLSRQATPASPFPLLGSRKARQMTVTSGRMCLKSLSAKDPLGAFLKMLVVTSTWASTRCYLTWKTKATPQGRLLFQLAPSMPRTDATGSGLWATPRTTDGTGGPNKLDEKGRRISQSNPNLVFGAKLADQVRMWPTPRAQEAKHGAATEWELQTDHAGTKDSLRVQVVKRMWPTPRKSMANRPTSREVNSGKTKGRLENAVQLWPTPVAHEARLGYQDRTTGKKGTQKSLTTEVIDEMGGRQATTGQLNPQWVAWLMGYPTGWLSSVPWETQSSRKSRRK